MLQDLQLAGLGERTHESYLRAVRKFAQWLGKAPDQASEDDLRRYLLFLKNDQHWEANSLKVAYSGLKFFYAHTCPREWPTLHKLRVPKQVKLPNVLTIAEVRQLLAAIRKPALRCFFWTVYSLGLRLQEALHLQVADIDAQRLLVHVRRGKGHKDRLVPLPPATLQLLRAHWSTHRHPQWLFPAEGRNHRQAAAAGRPMATNTPQDCIRKVVDELGWGARGISTHTLRHCISWNAAAPAPWDTPCIAATPAAHITPCPSPAATAIVPSARANGPNAGWRPNWPAVCRVPTS
jgi:integrase